MCSKLSKRQHLFDKLRTGRCSFLSSFFVLLLPISSCEICTAVSGGPHISQRRAHESHLSFFFLFFLLFDLLRSQSELRLQVRVRLRPVPFAYAEAGATPSRRGIIYGALEPITRLVARSVQRLTCLTVIFHAVISSYGIVFVCVVIQRIVDLLNHNVCAHVPKGCAGETQREMAESERERVRGLLPVTFQVEPVLAATFLA